MENAVQQHIWGWLSCLPLALSDAGHHAHGLELGLRLAKIAEPEELQFNLPLILARIGDKGEAARRLEHVLEEYPDDSHMLLRAGDTYQELGELSRAASCYRKAFSWAGDEGLHLHLARLWHRCDTSSSTVASA